MDQTAPEFLKKPQDIEVIAGQSAKFRCKVKGYPLPRVLWYKNGRRLINCEQYRIGMSINLLDCYLFKNMYYNDQLDSIYIHLFIFLFKVNRIVDIIIIMDFNFTILSS